VFAERHGGVIHRKWSTNREFILAAQQIQTRWTLEFLKWSMKERAIFF